MPVGNPSFNQESKQSIMHACKIATVDKCLEEFFSLDLKLDSSD